MTTQQPLSIAVEAEWDAEAEVWVATSDEVPGLVAEHRDLSALQAMVVELIPILLVENGVVGSGKPTRDLPIHMAAHALTRSVARVAA
jgi:hypothetical protein